MTEATTDTPLALERVVGTGDATLTTVRERIAALRGVGHPGVMVPRDVRMDTDDRVVVAVPQVDGADLHELARRRGPLTLGECVWLGERLGSALASLHAAGLAHGDVAPGNVLISGDVVVLVDTVAGCLADDQGTVGFRAPERVQEATPAADVYSWGALLRWAADEQAAALVEAWTAPTLAREPLERPAVRVAAAALSGCAPPQRVRVPAAGDVVTAVRARAVERTERIAEGRRWRLRRRLARGLALAAVAVAAIGIIAGVPRVVDAALPAGAATHPAGAATHPAGGDATMVSGDAPRSTRDRPAAHAAAARLTLDRAAALDAEDGAALRSLPAVGEVRAALDELARGIDQGRVAYDGLEVDVVDARTVAAGTDEATVRLDYRVSGHTVTASGAASDVEPYRQSVEMDLRWQGEWMAQRVRSAP